MAFKLSQRFLGEFEGKQPEWGFGALSYFVYKRTYAREMCTQCSINDPHYDAPVNQPAEERVCFKCRHTGAATNEEYVNTCRRVTESVFDIQRRHCTQNRLGWNAHKAQKTAQEFFRRMWEFKFTPPGRGLWVMGTRMVDRVGSAALNNPLHIETSILTKEYGWIPIGEIEGQKVTLLSNTKLYGRDKSTSANAKWVEGQISNIEMQPSVKIVFKDKVGRETHVIASENHRWFRKLNTKNPWERVTSTELLQGDLIPRTKPPMYYKPSRVGIMHGFFFGDGTRANGELHQFGEENIAVLNSLFTNTEEAAPTSNGCMHAVVRQCPLAWGHTPESHYLKDQRYLMGFLMGYFAADGCFTKSGQMRLSSARPKELLRVCELFKLIGISTSDIKLVSTSSNFSEDRELWETKINHADIPEWFLLKKSHRENYINRKKKFGHNYAKVVSIKKLESLQPVICATVPKYEQFVIDDFILTSNCGFTSTKDVKIELGNSFAWAMDMLMLGVGIGFDTKGANSANIKEPKKTEIVFCIPDSREGWVESVRLLINSYQGNGHIVKFDYSLIRPRGKPIRGFGGTASGPGPLRDLHENIRKILGGLDGGVLTSVAIVDLMNFIGKCVVAGNVRRSAELAIGEIDDKDYFKMKDYTLFPHELTDRRWASNNSVYAEPHSDFTEITPNISLNGEPGLIFINNARHYGRFKDGWIPFEDERYDNVDGFNPCAEQCLEDKELCCLVETYPANHDTVEDYHRTLKFAYMYAKTVTLVPTHDERTNGVMMRNRRIGCSMSGIQQAIKKFGINEFLSKFADGGYGVIRQWDRIYSRWLGVPRSIRMTTVKPSGTVSILAGATPGVHFTHAEYYMRTVRLPANSPLAIPVWMAGYKIEIDVTDNKKMGIPPKEQVRVTTIEEIQRASTEGATLIIYFPIKEKNFTKSKFEVSLWEQLCIVREMQHYWSDNAVSCTVTVREHEKDSLSSAIQYFAPYVKTLSFLPLVGHNYIQAPYIECEEKDYIECSKSIGKLNLESLQTFSVTGSKFCTNDSCTA